MRWHVPVLLLSFSILGCAPAKFVCTNPGAPPAPDPDLAERQCDLSGKEFPFENLAIEGGGVKGIAYAGALAVLDQAGLLEKKRALIRSGFDHTCEYLKQWQPGKVEEVCGTARPSRSPQRRPRHRVASPPLGEAGLGNPYSYQQPPTWFHLPQVVW
jgi:hypothetical protein